MDNLSMVMDGDEICDLKMLVITIALSTKIIFKNYPSIIINSTYYSLYFSKTIFKDYNPL